MYKTRGSVFRKFVSTMSFRNTVMHIVASSNYQPPIFLPSLLHWFRILWKLLFYGSAMTEHKVSEAGYRV